MKKLILLFFFTAFLADVVNGQSFDWNLRGGLNLMKPSGDDFSLLYHFGAQAGVRITNIGIYGEATYSTLENQHGAEPVAYFVPAILGKGYVLRSIFVEFGGAFLLRIDDTGSEEDSLNPENKMLPFAGMGIHKSKIEVSLRAMVKQSYGLMQLTAAVKF